MAKMFDAMKKPYVWIFASVVYIWLLGLIKLFATIGPAYVILRIAHTKNSFWITDIGKAFLFYAQEVSKQWGYRYEYVLYSFLANILIFIPAMVLGFFVIRKKLWARNTIIVLVSVYIVYTIPFGLLTSTWKFTILSLNKIILLAIIYVLMRKSSKEVFLRERGT
ncbi:MAG TPA: hypothetical protein DCP92_07690 [Nitrospiraceae bacterium]|jgi:hypothetical protein|nr:hypothetical protein [Nitrospiraceae bacterium]